jgi:hypothetical protein
MKAELAARRAAPGTGTTVDFSGKWVNELKSTMVLQQNGDQLDGKYTSAKSLDGSVASGALRGYVDGDLISFVVHWDEFQSITAWVGQLEKDGRTIETLWQMTKQVALGEEWASVNAGADTFTRA